MSLVELRVELPAYSYSFTIQVLDASTVLDVKQRIQAVCAGEPRVEGQRLIWRGRALSDEERLADIWKSPNDPRVVHLAVHPTAWAAAPPSLGGQTATHRLFPAQATLSSMQDILGTQAQPTLDPLAYVLFKHQTALQVLTNSNEQLVAPSILSRQASVNFVESLGWSWPAILDEDFPQRSPGGVKYTQIVHEGANYLSLEDATQVPTPAQAHAVRVLSYTLAILKSEPPLLTRAPSPPAVPSAGISPQVNAILQQLGIRNLPANLNINQGAQNAILEVPIRNQMPAPDLPQIQMRPFLLPVTFILLRIFLLLYFFAPARKPFIGAIILGWAVYEIWTRHIRAQNEPAAQVRRALGRLGANNALNEPGNNHRPAGPRPPLQNALALLDNVANTNLDQEEQTLAGTVTQSPSVLQKLQLFGTLFLSTLHPAVWDRRRAVLRQREGRLRTEATALQATDDGSETPENLATRQRRAEIAARQVQQPAWVQDYIQRVVENDWVED